MEGFKKYSHKLFAATLVIAILVSYYVLPAINVFANGEEFVLTFSIPDTEEYTFDTTKEHELAVADGEEPDPQDTQQMITIWQYLGFEIPDGHGTQVPSEKVSVQCADNKHCTVTIQDQQAIRIVVGGGRTFDTYYQGQYGEEIYHGNESDITGNMDFTIKAQPHYYHFNGNVVLLWACGEGVCAHTIAFPENHTGMYYVSNEDLVDQLGSNNVFSAKMSELDEDLVGVAFEDAWNDWISLYVDSTDGINSPADIDWSNMNANFVLNGNIAEIQDELTQEGKECYGLPDMMEVEACVNAKIGQKTVINTGVKIHNNGAENGANSLVSLGDNEFQLTIYNDDYAGLRVNTTEWNYIPGEVDPQNPDREYTYTMLDLDVSKSTEENPAVLDTFLLNDSLSFASNGLAGVTFKSVETVNVPDGAVDITNKGNGAFNVKFNSNFYDRTIFKITDTNNNVYYIRVVRKVIETNIVRFEPFYELEDSIIVRVFYPDTTTYDDYDVTATILYKDGSTDTKDLSVLGKIDLGGANIVNQKEFKGGKNCKQAVYYANIDDFRKLEEDSVGIYFNVKYKGSTESTYAGTFAGNGKGLFLKVDNRRWVLDYTR